MPASKFTLDEFQRLFPDNGACLQWLFQRHHAGRACPRCGATGQYYRQKNTSHYVCGCGGHQISPKAGTLFEHSSTDLTKWFLAIFWMSQSEKGVSAKELQLRLGVTYKTAWRMGARIRNLMRQGPLEPDEADWDFAEVEWDELDNGRLLCCKQRELEDLQRQVEEVRRQIDTIHTVEAMISRELREGSRGEH